MDATGTLNGGQIPDSATITLRGGGIHSADNFFPGIEDVGTITFESAQNSLGSFIRSPALVRVGRSTMSFVGTTSITTPLPTIGSGIFGTPSVGIIPWSDSFWTWQNGQVRALTTDEFSATVTSSGNPVNWRFSTTTLTLQNSVAVNSLYLTSGHLAGTDTVNVLSGAIRFGTGSILRIDTPIELGAQEGTVFAATQSSVPSAELNGNISGTNGVIFARGNITVRGNSTYSGPTHVSGDVRVRTNVIPGVPGAFGIDTSPIVLHAVHAPLANDATFTGYGTIRMSVFGGTTLFARDLRVEGYGDDFAQLQNESISGEISGNIDLDGNLALNRTGNPLVVSGVISGDGQLMLGRNVTLQGDNTFSGGVSFIDSPSVRVGSDTGFGSGRVDIRSINLSTLVRMEPVGGLRRINNPMILDSSVELYSPNTSNRFEFTGPVAFMPNSRISGSASAIFMGEITAFGTFTSDALRLAISPTHFPSLLSISNGRLKLLESGTASVAQSLAISNGSTEFGAVDVSNVGFVLDLLSSSATAPTLANVRDWITRGFAGGSWNGVGAIVSSTAAESTLADGVGYVAATDVFTSFPAMFLNREIDADDVLIRYTYAGDADLNGAVNIGDFSRLAANFNAPAIWSNGDFNYDGVANISDFSLMASNFNLSLAGDLPRTAVPEPSMFGAVAGAWAMAQRRRMIQRD